MRRRDGRSRSGIAELKQLTDPVQISAIQLLHVQVPDLNGGVHGRGRAGFAPCFLQSAVDLALDREADGGIEPKDAVILDHIGELVLHGAVHRMAEGEAHHHQGAAAGHADDGDDHPPKVRTDIPQDQPGIERQRGPLPGRLGPALGRRGLQKGHRRHLQQPPAGEPDGANRQQRAHADDDQSGDDGQRGTGDVRPVIHLIAPQDERLHPESGDQHAQQGAQQGAGYAEQQELCKYLPGIESQGLGGAHQRALLVDHLADRGVDHQGAYHHEQEGEGHLQPGDAVPRGIQLHEAHVAAGIGHDPSADAGQADLFPQGPVQIALVGLIPKDAGTGQLHIFFVIRFETDHDPV